MKYLLLFFIAIHSLIHLMGFAKAFNLAIMGQLKKPISRKEGTLWLFVSLLFAITGVLCYIDNTNWWGPGMVAVIVSQYLILKSWSDAKYGTILNVLFALLVIVGYGTWHFRNTYREDVMAMMKSIPQEEYLLQEKDIEHLPDLVKKYIRYTGSVGKPKVKSFKVELSGAIRGDAQSEWMPFTTEQYNFMDNPTRLFFMDATMKHLPVAGYHRYANTTASMDIRLLSLFTVQYQSGKEMDIAETVTFFNDMCCMAPATLIDKRINWLESEEDRVKAEFTNNGIRITAWLYFNDKGQLINFSSEDRYALTSDNTMKQFRWSTPMKEYKDFNGYQLSSYADGTYSYPEGDFIYGTFRINRVAYNLYEIE